MIDLSRYANVMTMIDHIFNEHFKLNIDISTLEDSSKGQQMIADVISAALIKNIYIVGSLNDKSKSEQVENFVSTLSNKLLENDFHLSSSSYAIDKADKNLSLPDDHDGNHRDDLPDIGCYEFLKTED